MEFDVPVERLGLPEAAKYAAFDYWTNAFFPSIDKRLTATLPPHACRILAVRPTQTHPMLISTSRHVTQGMVDVTDEKWEAAATGLAGTLSGRSKVVGGDAYEG